MIFIDFIYQMKHIFKCQSCMWCTLCI